MDELPISVVLCQHNKPSYVKISQSDGRQGQAYYICGCKEKCSFSKSLPEKLLRNCDKHPESYLELLCPFNDKKNLRIYYRCAQAKKNGEHGWCGKVQFTNYEENESSPESQKENRDSCNRSEIRHKPNSKTDVRKPRTDRSASAEDCGQNMSQKERTSQTGNPAIVTSSGRSDVQSMTSPSGLNDAQSMTSPSGNSDVQSVTSPSGNSDVQSMTSPSSVTEKRVSPRDGTERVSPRDGTERVSPRDRTERVSPRDGTDRVSPRDGDADIVHHGARPKHQNRSEEKSGLKQNVTPDTRVVTPDTPSFASLAQKSSSDTSAKTSSIVTNPGQWRNSPKPTRDPNKPTNQKSSNEKPGKEKPKVLHVSKHVAVEVRQILNEKKQITDKITAKKHLVKASNLSRLPDNGKKLLDGISELEEKLKHLDLKMAKTINESAKPADQSTTARVLSQQSEHPSAHLIGQRVDDDDVVIEKVTNEKPLVSRDLDFRPNQPQGQGHLKQATLFTQAGQLPQHVIQQMYAANPQAQTLYRSDGGRMTKAQIREVGSVTQDAIVKLHEQLEHCPGETEETDDPPGLLVSLMIHQRQALTWLTWRESQHPSGGILADDMGLGKTLTMISLMIMTKQAEKRNKKKNKDGGENKDGGDRKRADDGDDGADWMRKNDDADWMSKNEQIKKVDKSIIRSQATLVICPASLVHQWYQEIDRRTRKNTLRALLYHGPNRERDVNVLAAHDVVLTTYAIVSREVGAPADKSTAESAAKDELQDVSKQPNLLRIGWRRIVLDEGHTIKNHKSLGAMATCRLRAASRWVLTGTPIQNDLIDMYSLLRFLRCSPFDEYKVWKRQVEGKSDQGQKRLNTLIKTLLLRRTKDQKNAEGKSLIPLPTKQVTTHKLILATKERKIYDRIFTESQSAVRNYLERKEDGAPTRAPTHAGASTHPNSGFRPALPAGAPSHSAPQLPGARPLLQMNNNKPGGGGEILLMLLRLRQCCCHMSLLKEAVDPESLDSEGIDMPLEDQLSLLKLGEVQDPRDGNDLSMFDATSVSTKMQALLNHIDRMNEQRPPPKCVVVSQWTKMLEIVAQHLGKMGMDYHMIQGNVQPIKRAMMVDDFNSNPKGSRVMLLSLRAGGVGLNLVGASHLFILDIHWNPALELQAMDRIYRVGQTRDVQLHRFIVADTVEEKILKLQDQKLQLANNILTGGSVRRQKLSLDDLRDLFGLNQPQPRTW